MAFKNLGDILSKSINKSGIRRQIGAAMVVENFNQVVEEVFNPEVAKKIKALHLKHGVLTVACLSSVIAQELKFKEYEILEKINRGQKTKIVERLRFDV